MGRQIGAWLLLFGMLAIPVVSTAQRPGLPPEQHFKIGLNSQQQKQLETYFAEAGKQRQAAHAKLRALFEELQGLYDSYDYDAQKARAIREEIVVQQRRILAIHAENEAKLRRILNKDQFEKLRAQMKADREKHMQMWRNGGRRPGPPPEGAPNH